MGFGVYRSPFRLRAALTTAGIRAFFPVQSAVWRHLVGPTQSHRDLCVCAPTGSGKTFSYVLPIVQTLSKRVVKRLRALVVLPTRDLATQVGGGGDFRDSNFALKCVPAVAF